MMAEDLTDKQQRFCEEYIVDNNATQAAIRAGYSEASARQTASDTMSKPYIADKIAQLRHEQTARTLVDADYVIKGLLQVHQRCLQPEAITERVDGQEQDTGEFKFEHSGANKSLELLGKHLGMFATKLDITAVELTHEQWLESLD